MIVEQGNLGIGTTNPLAFVHASNDNDGATTIAVTNNGTGTNTRAILMVGAKTQDSKYGTLVHYALNEQTVLSGSDVNGLALNGTNKMTLGTNSNEWVRITDSGNVGIGTAIPDAKLTVKGDIHTQEVTVDLQGAVAPDFVFEDDYELKSLEETEEYIQANKHLPEIPSAAEMEENGFKLKKMNLKLLQKVEELTLYLIQQNKKLIDQEDRIADLERKQEGEK